VARQDVPTCRLDEPIADVRERVRAAGWDACVVVNEEGIVLGILRAAQLEAGRTGTTEEVMRPGLSTFRPHVPIDEMAGFMVDHDLASSPITASDGRLIGLLRREDAVREATCSTRTATPLRARHEYDARRAPSAHVRDVRRGPRALRLLRGRAVSSDDLRSMLADPARGVPASPPRPRRISIVGRKHGSPSPPPPKVDRDPGRRTDAAHLR
jgi:CBS-domain-containing membrane protein